jgi:hypothetical protein
MRHPPRREGNVSRFRAEQLVAELEGQLPFDNVEGLVEVVVVERRPAEAGE